MMKVTDENECTFLAIAASTDKTSILDTVLSAVKEDLDLSEVGHYVFHVAL